MLFLLLFVIILNHPKLYFYIETKSWYCWSHCGGNVDIFSIVMEQEGITFQESLKWVEKFFNLGENRGFGREFYVPPKREIIKKPIDITEQLPYYEESILNTFSNKLPIEWLQEGMLEEILKQFEIKIDINTCSIIIPHRDLNGKLIGVRCRNLKEESIEKFGKYTPYT